MCKCPKEVEYSSHTTWWEPCGLPEGHPGFCSGVWELKVQERGYHGTLLPANINYPVDANGSPL